MFLLFLQQEINPLSSTTTNSAGTSPSKTPAQTNTYVCPLHADSKCMTPCKVVFAQTPLMCVPFTQAVSAFPLVFNVQSKTPAQTNTYVFPLYTALPLVFNVQSKTPAQTNTCVHPLHMDSKWTPVFNSVSRTPAHHSSGAVWESRWPSWAVCLNEPSGFHGRKELLNHASALVSACPYYVNWHLRTLSITSSSSPAQNQHLCTSSSHKQELNPSI